MLNDSSIDLKPLRTSRSTSISSIRLNRSQRRQLKHLSCPHCAHSRCLSANTSYTRYYYDSTEDICANHQICVPVIYCSICHKYHSLPLELMIPHCSFSKRFVRKICDTCRELKNKAATARLYGISIKQLNHILTLENSITHHSQNPYVSLLNYLFDCLDKQEWVESAQFSSASVSRIKGQFREEDSSPKVDSIKETP